MEEKENVEKEELRGRKLTALPLTRKSDIYIYGVYYVQEIRESYLYMTI